MIRVVTAQATRRLARQGLGVARHAAAWGGDTMHASAYPDRPTVFAMNRRSFWWNTNKKDDNDAGAAVTNTSSTDGSDSTASSKDSSTDASESTPTNTFPSDSSDGTAITNTPINDSTPSVDETLEKIFAADAETTIDALQTAAEAWSPVWYNVADQAIVAVETFHNVSGFEYGWSIVGVTIVLRAFLFPLMVTAMRTSSRMAHLQPELNHMKARLEALGTPSRQDQIEFANKMKKLFQKYDVNPLKAFAAPLVQLPMFMGMFFGLRKMDSIYPQELSQGGMLWFPDLTAPDPYYVLPVLSGVTMLAMTEYSKDQMLASQTNVNGEVMLNFMRFMSVAMIPFIASFDASMLCYWTANNTLTFAQSVLLRQKSLRNYFGIWEPPKPVPGQETPSLFDTMNKISNRVRGKPNSVTEEIERHNQAIETKKRAKAMLKRAREKRRGLK